MSRLDTFIRRLQAQRLCLDVLAERLQGLPGPVLELGLGNGRTYDHLRERFPGRAIFVFDRQVAAHPDCIPPAEQLRLGDLVLAAHLTPGHTRGNMTWAWVSCENGRCLNMVDVGSLSAPDYQLVGNAKHPDLIKDYQASFAKIAALPCDIALAPHPGMVDFWERIAKREQGAADALIDPTRCRAYAEYARENFAAALAQQQKDAVAAKP